METLSEWEEVNFGSLGAMEERSIHLSCQILMELPSPTVHLLPNYRTVARDLIFLLLHVPADELLGCYIEKFPKYLVLNHVSQRDEDAKTCQPSLSMLASFTLVNSPNT